MREQVRSGRRGVHRFRAVFLAEEGRLMSAFDAAEGEREVRRRLRESIRQRQAACFLIADYRLLGTSHPMHSLLPRDLRERLAAIQRIPERSGQMLTQPRLRNGRRLYRVLLPWIAAVSAVASGYWVFLQGTP